MKKRYKIILICIILALVIGTLGKYMIDKMEKDLDLLLETEVQDIDLSLVSDGIYHGSYDAGIIKVIVDVEVINHEITSITLVKHQTGQGQDAKLIIDDVIAMQSLDVDMILGATYSSKVILLAIYDALA